MSFDSFGLSDSCLKLPYVYDQADVRCLLVCDSALTLAKKQRKVQGILTKHLAKLGTDTK